MLSEPISLYERQHAESTSEPLLDFVQADKRVVAYSQSSSSIGEPVSADSSLPWVIRGMFFLAFGSPSCIGRCYQSIMILGYIFFFGFEIYRFIDLKRSGKIVEHSDSYLGVWASLCIEGIANMFFGAWYVNTAGVRSNRLWLLTNNGQ
jgi:hypothetical protein